ncbi:hypothetical protein N9H93_02930 [Rhizobiaceae bacterium]|nr:hypothetical protein [Rhizobiaceae bacterium]
MTDIAALAAVHASWVDNRSRATAENIANADTPDFRRAEAASFAETLKGVPDDGGFAMTRSHVDHLNVYAGASNAHIRRGGDVSLQREMVDLAANRREHDLNVAISASFHRFHMTVARP